MSYSLRETVDKLLYQYRDSPVMLDLFEALFKGLDEIDATLELLKTRLDIDLSEGVQLDGIGEIVGQPRPLTEEIDPSEVFAFAGGTGKGFSGIGRPDVGGRFKGIDGLIIGPMPDEDYRVLLKAVVFSNYSNSTLDDIARYIEFVLGFTPEVEEGIGFVDITYPVAVSNVQRRIMLSKIPTAAGIRVRGEFYLLNLTNENGDFYELSNGSLWAVRQALGAL